MVLSIVPQKANSTSEVPTIFWGAGISGDICFKELCKPASSEERYVSPKHFREDMLFFFLPPPPNFFLKSNFEVS